MKKTKRTLLSFIILLYLSTLFVGCRSKNVEPREIENEHPKIIQNDFIEVAPASRIGKETLQYPGKTE